MAMNKKIMAANGEHIHMKGTVNLKVQIREKTFPHNFCHKRTWTRKTCAYPVKQFWDESSSCRRSKRPSCLLLGWLEIVLVTIQNAPVNKHMSYYFYPDAPNNDMKDKDCLIVKTSVGNRSDSLLEGLPKLVTDKGVKLAIGLMTLNVTGQFQAIIATPSNQSVHLPKGVTVGQLSLTDNATVRN